MVYAFGMRLGTWFNPSYSLLCLLCNLLSLIVHCPSKDMCTHEKIKTFVGFMFPSAIFRVSMCIKYKKMHFLEVKGKKEWLQKLFDSIKFGLAFSLKQGLKPIKVLRDKKTILIQSTIIYFNIFY